MEHESLAMAMAKLAKTAKHIPPKISFPISGDGENGEKAQSPEPGKPAFRQFRQNSHRHPVGINFSARPHVTIEELPDRLVTAATRVCRELHNDDDQAVQEMLADLCWNDPKDWDALVDHFEAQLPPPPPKVTTMVTCDGCRHAEYPRHSAIAYCGAGAESGIPTGGWWATDLHPCAQREVRTPGKAIHHEEPTC